MSGEARDGEFKTALQEFTRIIIERDEKRDQGLIRQMSKLADEMSKLASIMSVSEQKHEETRRDRDKTDVILSDHNKRIHDAEAQILLLKGSDLAASKRWDRVDKIKAGFLGGILLLLATTVIKLV